MSTGPNLETLLIIDLECTCWEGQPPSGQSKEIIEIGICPLNIIERCPEEPESILVIPSESEISEFCTNLTGWSHKEVFSKGRTLPEACKYIMKKYNATCFPYAAWGEFDRCHLFYECSKKKARFPFYDSFINIKNLFSICNRLGRGRGLATALEKSSIVLDGQHHRGRDDALNTAYLMIDLLETFDRGSKLFHSQS